MTEILLVQPRLEMHASPPLGLAYIAATLEEHGTHVKIIDLNQKSYGNRSISILNNILRHENPKLVGISCLTSYYDQAKTIARLVKDYDEEIKVVMGGIHPSSLPKLVLHDENVDFVVVGEGEFTTLELCQNLDRKEKYPTIDGFGFKENGKIVINKPRKLIDDLDRLPFPSWHLIPPSEYPPSPQGFFVKDYPVAPIITSRGCPYACTYCASNNFWRRKWRARSPDNVVSEIELLAEKYGVKEVEISDDNFTLDKIRAGKICEGLIRRNLNIHWSCPNGIRVDKIDRELLRKMKRSGCYMIIFGVESLSERVLRRVRKKTDISQIKKAVKISRHEGIITGGFFIFGLPYETSNSALQTIKLAKKLDLDFAQFHVFTPLPGSTEFSNWIKKEKIDLFQLDFSSFNILRGNIGNYETDLTLKDLRKLKNRAFFEFYSRPFTLLNFFRKIKFRQTYWFAKRLIAAFSS